MYKSILFIAFFIGLNCFATANKTIASDPKSEAKLLEIVYNSLLKKHLVTKKIDDNFSKNVFKTYITLIDNNKLFFYQSDIDEFKKFETKIDDQVKNNDLSFFNLTRDRLLVRMDESKEIYKNIIKNKLNFTNQDESENEVEKINFAKNKAELTRRWTSALKSIVVADLKQNYQSNTELNIEKFIEEHQQGELSRRIEVSTLSANNMNKSIVFEHFLNAIVQQFDVHSEFYLPFQRDEYLIKQSGKSEGVGIQTAFKNDFITIQNITTGGPVWKTKKIDLGDVILKVGQGEDEPVSVIGFSLYETAKLTRGRSGTTVKLTIKKPDGTVLVVPMKRAVVSSNDTYIKSCLVSKNKIKYGIISFPKFYNDFDDDQVRNVVNDFEEELLILKQSDVQGIIIDIRGNGGGSVEAAVKIIGNFIAKNPVVQFKNRDQQLTVLKSENDTKNWDKAVVLIVDAQTASAAEIIAASFQEFNIGVVIGDTTFGKGTIQEFIDLNTFNIKKIDDIDLGALRITTQKYYQLSGKSLQKTGVEPEINFETKNKISRESSNSNSLAADNVKPIDFIKNNIDNYFDNIISNSKLRLFKNDYYINLINNSFLTDLAGIETFNVAKLGTQLKYFVEKQEKSLINNYQNKLVFSGTAADIKLLRSKEYLVQKRKNWYQSLTKDLLIEEGLNILEDINSSK